MDATTPSKTPWSTLKGKRRKKESSSETAVPPQAPWSSPEAVEWSPSEPTPPPARSSAVKKGAKIKLFLPKSVVEAGGEDFLSHFGTFGGPWPAHQEVKRNLQIDTVVTDFFVGGEEFSSNTPPPAEFAWRPDVAIPGPPQPPIVPVYPYAVYPRYVPYPVANFPAQVYPYFFPTDQSLPKSAPEAEDEKF
jgi:hypothetical protein